MSTLDTRAPLIAYFTTLGLGAAFTVPLTGMFVRYLAAYDPRRLALDADGRAQIHAVLVDNSFFAIMSRVYRHEVNRLCIVSRGNKA
jgi:hypothetical protein